MDLVRDKVGNVLVVAPQVENLDASNTKEFRRDIEALIEPNAKVVLDLTKVNFVDSSGCGAILSYLRQLNTVGGDLKLCGISKSVRALFQLVRMHRIFDILNTRDEAVKAYQV